MHARLYLSNCKGLHVKMSPGLNGIILNFYPDEKLGSLMNLPANYSLKCLTIDIIFDKDDIQSNPPDMTDT